MPYFVVFIKDSKTPVDVHYTYDFFDAMNYKESAENRTGVKHVIAEIVNDSSRVYKFFAWLERTLR